MLDGVERELCDLLANAPVHCGNFSGYRFQSGGWAIARLWTSKRLRVHFLSVQWLQFFFLFFWVAAPLKWSKPKKGFPSFSRVTEQLSFPLPSNSLGSGEFPVSHQPGLPQKMTRLSMEQLEVSQPSGRSHVVSGVIRFTLTSICRNAVFFFWWF